MSIAPLRMAMSASLALGDDGLPAAAEPSALDAAAWLAAAGALALGAASLAAAVAAFAFAGGALADTAGELDCTPPPQAANTTEAAPAASLKKCLRSILSPPLTRTG